MARILTGIQSTNIPHLGNLLGAIIPAIALSKRDEHESMFFIADLHTLTSRKEAEFIRDITRATAAAWLAMGLDTTRSLFYRQSRVPQVTELTWYLDCFTPYPMLANAHSFKEKSERLSDVNAGLFTYPVLMAADILLYDADFVPVGKDQLQHLEIAADIARAFNHKCSSEVFVVPQAITDDRVMIVPGTDGRKMSKSYNNFINIFLPEKELRKAVMSIVTDSKPVEAPKDPDNDNVFNIFRVVAADDAVASLRSEYVAGGMGYGRAKTALLETLLSRFAEERRKFGELMNDAPALETALAAGEEKAREMADRKLRKIRALLGYS